MKRDLIGDYTLAKGEGEIKKRRLIFDLATGRWSDRQQLINKTLSIERCLLLVPSPPFYFTHGTRMIEIWHTSPSSPFHHTVLQYQPSGTRNELMIATRRRRNRKRSVGKGEKDPGWPLLSLSLHCPDHDFKSQNAQKANLHEGSEPQLHSIKCSSRHKV